MELNRVKSNFIKNGITKSDLGALHGAPSSSAVARAENSPMMIGRPDRLYMD